MATKDIRTIDSPYLARIISEIEAEDISYLAKNALATRLHAERLSENGRPTRASIVRSSFDSDVRSFGLLPSVLKSRIGDSLNYEEVRKAISNYVDELKQKVKFNP